MKIRSQLLLACFLLAVLPLTGIVFYSYHSSKQALERAYQGEATRLTAQMDRRLGTIRADLDQRLAGLSAIPLGDLQTATKPATMATRSGMVDNILMAMGEAAPLVDALEFVPAPRPPAVAQATPVVQPTPRVAPHAVPAVPTSPAPRVAVLAPPAAPTPPADPDEASADETDPDEEKATADTGLTEPIVIDLPPVKYPKFTMPPDFARRVAEISNLSVKISNPATTAEEREALGKELKAKQDELNQTMQASREGFHQAMEVANQQRRERQMLLDQRREQVAEKREAERAKQRAERDRQRAEKENQKKAEAVATTPPPTPAPKPVARVVTVRSLTPDQKDLLRWKEKQAALLFGQHFDVPLHSEGRVVGQIRAQLSTEEVIKRVLGAPNEDTSEIPFAVDREGTVYTRNTTERATLDRLGVIDSFKQKKPIPHVPNWVIAMSFDKQSGLRFGVARPVGENLEELKNTAARNFGWGIGVIALALVGILPVAGHFTRDVEIVTTGAERIAQGDLMTRLPVRSNNEFGQLAKAFNQMAEDLSVQQQKLVEQERARREADIQQRILALEYERKSVELEDARRFQLSMLPKHVPVHDRFEIGALTQTATEVGGDYYDFHVSPGGVLSVTIGDATGHGAKAGTMVTVVKTLFSGYNASTEPSTFLGDSAEKIKSMELGRMAMALGLARFDGDRLTIASAGMPPVLIHRAATDRVEEIELGATPLGTLGVDYKQKDTRVAAGDTVLLMSDGFPELQNAEGHQLGYQGAMQEFAAAASEATADGVIARLRDAATRWHGDAPPNDDITFVVVRCRA